MTLESVKDLGDRDIDTKIAKILGWNGAEGLFHRIPTYSQCLNAISGIANYLRNANRLQYQEYHEHLNHMIANYNSLPEREPYPPFNVADAPARLRAEAILLTLGGGHE